MLAPTKGLSILFPLNKLGFNSLTNTLWTVAGLCWGKKKASARGGYHMKITNPKCTTAGTTPQAQAGI